MRMLVFAKRNVKEIVRDPLTLFFGIAFPSILLLLLTIIQHNVPAEASPFPAERLTPSITIFGLSFITLFSALIVSKDRSGSLLQRLLSSLCRSFRWFWRRESFATLSAWRSVSKRPLTC